MSFEMPKNNSHEGTVVTRSTTKAERDNQDRREKFERIAEGDICCFSQRDEAGNKGELIFDLTVVSKDSIAQEVVLGYNKEGTTSIRVPFDQLDQIVDIKKPNL